MANAHISRAVGEARYNIAVARYQAAAIINDAMVIANCLINTSGEACAELDEDAQVMAHGLAESEVKDVYAAAQAKVNANEKADECVAAAEAEAMQHVTVTKRQAEDSVDAASAKAASYYRYEEFFSSPRYSLEKARFITAAFIRQRSLNLWPLLLRRPRLSLSPRLPI